MSGYLRQYPRDADGNVLPITINQVVRFRAKQGTIVICKDITDGEFCHLARVIDGDTEDYLNAADADFIPLVPNDNFSVTKNHQIILHDGDFAIRVKAIGANPEIYIKNSGY